MKKGFLKTAFDAATGTAGYAAERTIGKYLERKDDVEFPSPAAVPLTSGESALLKSIFGNEINTSIIRKHFAEAASPYAIAATFSSSKVKFYGKQNHSPDYSQTKDTFNYWTFVHEMTHAWQYQHPVQDFSRSVNAPTREYGYELSPKKRFQDFGVEQQASIVADYAQQFIYEGPYKPANQNNGLYMPAETDNFKPQSLDLLQKVIEDRFPVARNTRLKLEAKKSSGPATPPPQTKWGF